MSGAPDQSAFLIQAALEAVGDGITLADRAGRIIYSNPAADEILGVRASSGPAEDWGNHYGVFLPDGVTPFPTEQYTLVRALRGEETTGVEMLIRNSARPDGTRISVTGRPIRDARGDIEGAVVVFHDVTALRRVENQLKCALVTLAETQRLREELAAFVVHDLKSPITSILALSELTLLENRLHPEDRESLLEVTEAARALHGMALDILDVQMAEEGHLKPTLAPVPVQDLLEEVAYAAAGRARGVEMRVGAADGLQVLGDRDLLHRVVTNLVDNCIKYGPQGGCIWLDASSREPGTVRIRVRDEGSGVPPELREMIFEKYAKLERNEQARHVGSRGLGLRMCKVAVDALGGRIWVEDNVPVGACFCVELRAP